MVFYSPSDIASLKGNYPDFKQESMLFATYGPNTARAVKEEGIKISIEAPSPEYASISDALNLYLGKL